MKRQVECKKKIKFKESFRIKARAKAGEFRFAYNVRKGGWEASLRIKADLLKTEGVDELLSIFAYYFDALDLPLCMDFSIIIEVEPGKIHKVQFEGLYWDGLHTKGFAHNVWYEGYEHIQDETLKARAAEIISGIIKFTLIRRLYGNEIKNPYN